MDCAFAVQRAKEGTGRVVGWKELAITNSFTLEASFCGADFGKYQDLHFNISMLCEMGYNLCENVLEYDTLDEATYKQVVQEIDDILQN